MEEPVHITLRENTIVLVSILLAASLLIGLRYNDYTLLKFLLLFGMFFSWTILLNGLLGIVAEDTYRRLKEEKGAIKYIIMMIFLILAATLLLFFISFTDINVI